MKLVKALPKLIQLIFSSLPILSWRSKTLSEVQIPWVLGVATNCVWTLYIEPTSSGIRKAQAKKPPSYKNKYLDRCSGKISSQRLHIRIFQLISFMFISRICRILRSADRIAVLASLLGFRSPWWKAFMFHDFSFIGLVLQLFLSTCSHSSLVFAVVLFLLLFFS